MNKPENYKTSPIKNRLSSMSLKLAAFLAFFPITGILGLHNIVLKRYAFCAIRAIIAIVLITLLICGVIYNMFPEHPIHVMLYQSGMMPGIFSIISFISPAPIVGLYAWSINEGVQMLQDQRQSKTTKNDIDYGAISATISVLLLGFWWVLVKLSHLLTDANDGDTAGIIAATIAILVIEIIFSVYSMYLGIKELRTKDSGLSKLSFIILTVSMAMIPYYIVWLCQHL